MYTSYQQAPENVEEGWRLFFKGFDLALNSNGHSSEASAGVDSEKLGKEIKVFAIIKAYRDRGHLRSTTNPIACAHAARL